MTEPEDPFGGALRHVRRAVPPWSAVDVTICGRPVPDVTVVLTAPEAAALIRRVGRGRAAFLFCQTCVNRYDTLRRLSGALEGQWDMEPAESVADYAQRVLHRNDPTALLVRAELWALADLVAAHADEYADRVAARATPDALAERRRAKPRR